MNKILLLCFLFIFNQTGTWASDNKDEIINKLQKINNLSFSFIQTINDNDEKGECIIQYPKKIFCKYEEKNNKILVSNGTSIVIKKRQQYYRYPIKSTPFEFLLDKNFLLKKINISKLDVIEDKYLLVNIDENNNNINIFFSKKSFDIVGWQIEDVYQNLVVTYIYDISYNNKIDEKIFKLPSNN